MHISGEPVTFTRASSAGLLGAALLIATTSWTAGCGPRLHFRRSSILSVANDAETQSTRVATTFEVWDGEQQLTSLSRENFVVYEDGQPATSESLSEADTTEQRVPVVLVLDTSLSMYQANAMGALKTAATGFVRDLSSNGFAVTTYRFASGIETVADPSTIPDSFDEAGGERWTSLYAAVAEAMRDHPDAIVVVFSDGADNYSQNHGVPGLGAIEGEVLPATRGGNGRMRVVHTIGFGNVATERDREGVPASGALERLARNGSFHYAGQPGALDAVFRDVAERIRNVYVYEYFSPNLSGSHQLQVEVQVGGRRARTEPMVFTAGGAGAAATDLRGAVTELLRRLGAECPSGIDPQLCERAVAMRLLTRTATHPMAREIARLASAERIPAGFEHWCGRGYAQACEAAGRPAPASPVPLPSVLDGWELTQRELCDSGSGPACIQLGVVLRDGFTGGLEPNHPAALEVFRRTCAAGEAEACVGAASMLARGWGTPADPAAAGVVFREHCEAGRFSACGYLGRLQVLGEGVPRNEEEGMRRLEAACAQPHPASCQFLEEHRRGRRPGS